jgi:hypothetical protein
MTKFAAITLTIFLFYLTLLGCNQTTAPTETHTLQPMSHEQQDMPDQAPAGFQVTVLIEPRTVVAGSALAVHLVISNHGPRAVFVSGGFSCFDYGYVARDVKGDVATDSWTGVDCIGSSAGWPWIIQPGETFTVLAPTAGNLSYLAPGRYWIEGKIFSWSRATTPPVLLTILASNENETKSGLRQTSRTR